MELSPNYLIIKHSAFPLDVESDDPHHPVACKKVLGGPRRRARAFRPASLVNVSGMSFGALSGPAIEALNRSARAAGCLHNTGEGGVSVHHLQGGDLVLQIGTGYFGCRDAAGRFSLKRLEESLARGPFRALEIKLSQGAKPGVGGLLPKRKISAEIAAARGVPRDRDCVSPGHHRRSATPTACWTSSSVWRTPRTCRSASSRPWGIWGSGAIWHG